MRAACNGGAGVYYCKQKKCCPTAASFFHRGEMSGRYCFGVKEVTALIASLPRRAESVSSFQLHKLPITSLYLPSPLKSAKMASNLLKLALIASKMPQNSEQSPFHLKQSLFYLKQSPSHRKQWRFHRKQWQFCFKQQPLYLKQ